MVARSKGRSTCGEGAAADCYDRLLRGPLLELIAGEVDLSRVQAVPVVQNALVAGAADLAAEPIVKDQGGDGTLAEARTSRCPLLWPERGLRAPVLLQLDAKRCEIPTVGMIVRNDRFQHRHLLLSSPLHRSLQRRASGAGGETSAVTPRRLGRRGGAPPPVQPMGAAWMPVPGRRIVIRTVQRRQPEKLEAGPAIHPLGHAGRRTGAPIHEQPDPRCRIDAARHVGRLGLDGISEGIAVGVLAHKAGIDDVRCLCGESSHAARGADRCSPDFVVIALAHGSHHRTRVATGVELASTHDRPRRQVYDSGRASTFAPSTRATRCEARWLACWTRRVIALGLAGHSGAAGRDLTIDAMNAAAKRLTRRYVAEVSAVRCRDGRHEVDAFMVWTGPVVVGRSTEWRGPVFRVPVRRRSHLGPWTHSWQDVQSVAAAAAEVGRMVPRSSD